MIEAVKITKYFDDKLVLNDVSFRVEKGEVCGYIGPNGAGKTTTIKILIGMLKPSSGTARINGIDVIENPMAVKKLIGYVPESGAIFETLTPIEFLRFVGRIYQMDEKLLEIRANELMEIFEISDQKNEPLLNFSKGMKQKVLIISALLHDPKVLVLDEPLNGLDANAIQILKEIIKKLAENQRTIFYSSHLLDIVEKICDKLIIINRGKIIASGSISEVLNLANASTLDDAFAKLIQREKISKEKLNTLINKPEQSL